MDLRRSFPGYYGAVSIRDNKPEAMFKFLLPLCLLFAVGASAAEIYRWKDANGTIHFSDSQSAPPNSTKLETKDASAPAVTPAGPGNGADFAGIAAEKISVCAGYAKTMVGLPGSNGIWRSAAARIKSTCPGVGFQCHTYFQHAGQDHCAPFAINNQVFFRETRHGFPAAAPVAGGAAGSLPPRLRQSIAQTRPAAPVPSTESAECKKARYMVKGIEEKRLYRARGGPLAAEKDRVYLDNTELELFRNDVKQYC